jgi:hypothetical protein
MRNVTDKIFGENQSKLFVLYVQVTVHCDNLRINNQQDASCIQNFVLSRNSTCFGHLLCLSSRVIGCTRGNWYVSCRLCGRCLGESGRNGVIHSVEKVLSDMWISVMLFNNSSYMNISRLETIRHTFILCDQVTVHDDNLRINNQQDASSIQNFILSRNSTCFGHLLCLSSGVISCTLGNRYISFRLCGRCLGESVGTTWLS